MLPTGVRLRTPRAMTMAALAAAVTSCSLLVDERLEDDDASPVAEGDGGAPRGSGGPGSGKGAGAGASTAASGGEAAGAGGDGGGAATGATAGSGGSLVCGASPDGEAACPGAPCNGGCFGGVCRVLCVGTDACKDDPIVCPPGLPCAVQCEGKAACKTAQVSCPPGHGCQLTCDGEDACADGRVTAGAGPLEVICSAKKKTCEKLDVHCGANLCQASCEGVSAPKLHCNGSCECVGCAADP